MKSRKNMITTAIIVLILVLGVGYATVSSVSLNITGTATAETKDLEVYFDGTNSGVEKDKVTAITSTAKTREATFTVNNMTLNEEVTMTFEVKNYETDVDASLAEPTVTNSNTKYFTVTSSVDKDTLPAGNTATVTVTVKLIKTAISEENGKTNVTVKLDAEPIDME